MAKLDRDFYLQSDVIKISKSLIGTHLYSNINGETVCGIISETEAYNGITDKASHAYKNRRTPRTEVMFEEGGVAYVYLCYGIHHLFNIVTNVKGIPHAVLIRNIIPVSGQDVIRKRRNSTSAGLSLTGPGTLTQAYGINLSHNRESLTGNKIWVEENKLGHLDISETPRIGVDYAGDDALLNYRFVLNPITKF